MQKKETYMICPYSFDGCYQERCMAWVASLNLEYGQVKTDEKRGVCQFVEKGIPPR